MPIAMDEFEGLEQVQPGRKQAKVPNDVLLDELSRHAMTVKEIAEFIEGARGTAYSRLQRLEKENKVVRRAAADGVQYWASTGYIED
jgi:hypothetical protein